jgi:hypothetical protein
MPGDGRGFGPGGSYVILRHPIHHGFCIAHIIFAATRATPILDIFTQSAKIAVASGDRNLLPAPSFTYLVFVTATYYPRSATDIITFYPGRQDGGGAATLRHRSPFPRPTPATANFHLVTFSSV